MKKLILICGLLTSSFSFGADWIYAISSNSESFWVDRGFYKYNIKNNTVDVWNKTIKKKSNSDDYYTGSKSLDRYSCLDKSTKNLAYVEYEEWGTVSKSNSTPSKVFSIIFPDSIAEGIWKVACGSKGKGFRFTKRQLETISIFDMQEKYGVGKAFNPEYVPLEKLGKNTNNISKPSLSDFDSIDGYILSIYKYYGVDYPQPYYITEPHGVAPKFDNYKSITDFENAIQNYAQKIKF